MGSLKARSVARKEPTWGEAALWVRAEGIASARRRMRPGEALAWEALAAAGFDAGALALGQQWRLCQFFRREAGRRGRKIELAAKRRRARSRNLPQRRRAAQG
jgi:hypothetical protein